MKNEKSFKFLKNNVKVISFGFQSNVYDISILTITITIIKNIINFRH